MCKRAMHLLMATSAMTMYTQYFSMNDFSRGASTGLPSAVTGGGTRRAGLQGALRPRGRETRESVPPAMNHAAGRAGKQGGSGDNRLRREEKQRARPPQNRIGKESARKTEERQRKRSEHAQRWECRRPERDGRVGNRPELGGARSRARARLAAFAPRARAVVRDGPHEVVEAERGAVLVEVDRERLGRA